MLPSKNTWCIAPHWHKKQNKHAISYRLNAIIMNKYIPVPLCEVMGSPTH